MKKKMISSAIAMLLCLSLAAGCSMDSTVQKDDKKEEKTKKEDLSEINIGASVMSLQHEFMANLVVGYKEFKEQTGVNIIITDGGNMEPDKQVTNVENYISQNVDGILCQCISVETMKDTLKHAMIPPWAPPRILDIMSTSGARSWGRQRLLGLRTSLMERRKF